MELKYAINSKLPYEIASLNRTFMELKYMEQERIKRPQQVLIEPLWN